MCRFSSSSSSVSLLLLRVFIFVYRFYFGYVEAKEILSFVYSWKATKRYSSSFCINVWWFFFCPMHLLKSGRFAGAHWVILKYFYCIFSSFFFYFFLFNDFNAFIFANYAPLFYVCNICIMYCAQPIYEMWIWKISLTGLYKLKKKRNKNHFIASEYRPVTRVPTFDVNVSLRQVDNLI